MRIRSHLATVTALLAFGALLLPPSSLAGTVSIDGRSLLFTAATGEVNDTIIDNYHRPTTFVDFGAPLVAGPGCRQVMLFECDYWDSSTAHLGDGDDKARLNSWLGSTVHGEAGNDTIASDGEIGAAYGGPGADTIRATGNGSAAYGGPGPDHIEGGGTESTGMLGEEGKDVLTQTRLSGCKSSMDGGPGADRLLGYACTRLIGGRGDRRDDRLPQRPGRRPSGKIRRRTGPRLHRRRTRAATRIDAGPGRDFIQAAADGVPDTIVCGTGRDTVRANPADTVAADCEHVTIITPPLA